MKILIGGGGTGGHVYPALALARHALAVDGSTEVLFVGTSGGLENRIVPAAGFPLVTITARGFSRSFKHLGSTLLDFFRGTRRSLGIIAEFGPDVVLGTGGYVAAPLGVAALLKKRPLVLHEQNALPGLVNRWLSLFARRVCLSFRETGARMPSCSRPVYTGNPRASEVARVERKQGCRHFGFDPSGKTILVYGGSRGSLAINRVVGAYLQNNLLPEETNMIFVTGDYYYREVSGELNNLPERVRIYPYLEKMPEALAASNLVVVRSGATTVAEITALGLPAILVPSPNVVNNHQYYNARLLSDAGAAVLIEEKDFCYRRLQEEINAVFNEPGALEEMSRRSRKLGVTDAAPRLYHCLKEVAS